MAVTQKQQNLPLFNQDLTENQVWPASAPACFINDEYSSKKKESSHKSDYLINVNKSTYQEISQTLRLHNYSL